MISYADVVETPYLDDSAIFLLTIHEVTLLVFLLSQALSPDEWTDYAEYHDEIDELVAGAIGRLTFSE